MTKESAESLDNPDGQVSLETLVYLEIKEKEVTFLLLKALWLEAAEDGDVKKAHYDLGNW